MAAPSRTDFWGVELTGKKQEALWTGDEEQDEEDENDPDIIHTLHIQRVILGANAKDSEPNLLTVTAENTKGEEITHPLAWLNKKSVSESQCSMHIALPPPVTFKLAQGSGPVHVIGVWEQQIDDDFNFSDEESEESDGNEMNEMMVPRDNIKAITAPPKVIKDIETKQAKKRPAESPPPKAAKVAKKDESSKKRDIPKFNVVDEKESDEDEEQGSEEEDNDNGEDMDDEEGSNEEESEEDEESEEEAPPPKMKSKQMMKAAAKQKVTTTNTPKSIGDKTKKTPKTTPAGPLSLDQIKAKLAKSPNVPKKREKFNNYLQNNLKVTDTEMKNKLWSFVQQNKH
ncbi:nucleoplasmin-like protein ANO39 isoform X2 [Dysidea avara]|uniref:nucleoplasmin-like protein ANO39 isoform X2 n=1 Tax=Dysidea avara TaxID=196820 RepID=UPI00332F38B2